MWYKIQNQIADAIISQNIPLTTRQNLQNFTIYQSDFLAPVMISHFTANIKTFFPLFFN